MEAVVAAHGVGMTLPIITYGCKAPVSTYFFLDFSTNCSVRVSAHVKSVHKVQMESDKQWERPHPLLLFQFIATAVYSI